MFRIIFGLLMVCMTQIASAQSVFTKQDEGKLVELKTGASFQVQLAENPSTGYAWNIVEGSPAIKLVESKFDQAQTGLPGSGGLRRIVFKLTKPGAVRLVLKYFRPWEKSDTAVDSFQLNITTDKK